jgi:hypothetical protein
VKSVKVVVNGGTVCLRDWVGKIIGKGSIESGC